MPADLLRIPRRFPQSTSFPGWRDPADRTARPLDRSLQLAGDHMWFDDGDEVQLVDLDDAIEALHRENHAAVGGHRTACVSGACATHDERHALLVAQAGDGGHFGSVGRNDDEIWRSGRCRVRPARTPRGMQRQSGRNGRRRSRQRGRRSYLEDSPLRAAGEVSSSNAAPPPFKRPLPAARTRQSAAGV